ncbi:MAG: hypothetical protein K0Q50_1781 [Vampirovibrio sp.]|nr:hypothetical protein [Vampirovibrio sp.]
MKNLEVSIDIEAPPDSVWQVLTDFAQYPAWNPFIVSLTGIAAPGETLQEIVRQPDGKQLQFTSRIVIYEPAKHLAWDGYFGAPFLFMGRHEFILESAPFGTRFTQRERFTGLMLPFLNIDSVLPGYRHMNDALKKRVESLSG